MGTGLGLHFHMTSRRDWLSDFKPLDGGSVFMGNNQSCKVADIGTMVFKMWDGSIKRLENIRLVPNLRRILFLSA